MDEMRSKFSCGKCQSCIYPMDQTAESSGSSLVSISDVLSLPSASSQGPRNPFSKSELADGRRMNSEAGLVERCHMDPVEFHRALYGSDRRGGARRKKRRKGAFVGPWDALDEEKELLKELDVAEESEEEEQQEAQDSKDAQLKVEKTENPQKSEGIEQSEFHLDERYDYQGRTFLCPPSMLKPREHRCFVPKRVIHTYRGHTKAVSAIRFFPVYGHLLLSAGMDHKVKIWNVYNQRNCVQTYSGHSAGIRDICFSNDGDKFLSAGYDNYVKYWDTETGKCIGRFNSGSTPYCVKLNPKEQNEFICGQSNNKIVQWDIRQNRIVQYYEEHLGPVNTVTFIDENRRFVSTSDDKKLFVWEYGIPVVVKHVSDPSIHSMPATSLSPSGKWLLAQSLDNQVLVFSCQDKLKMYSKKRFTGHQCAGYAAGVNFSPDGQFVISGDGNGRCFFWDWKKAAVLTKIQCHDKVTIGCEWHPIEPSRVATCSWDGTIKLLD